MALVGLRPQMCLAGRFNEARRDAHTFTLATDAPFEQVIGAQDPADFARPFARALERHGGPPGDNADTSSATRAELRDHLLGQAVGEIVLSFGIAEVREWKHREPHARCSAGRLVSLDWSRRDESISPSRKRLDEARVVGGVAKRRSQPLHGGVEAVLEIDKRAVRPEPLAQLVPGDHVAWTLEHQSKDFERLLLQPDAHAVLPQLAGSDVELERAKAQPLSRL